MPTTGISSGGTVGGVDKCSGVLFMKSTIGRAMNFFLIVGFNKTYN